jgi:hypothetical protein
MTAKLPDWIVREAYQEYANGAAYWELAEWYETSRTVWPEAFRRLGLPLLGCRGRDKRQREVSAECEVSEYDPYGLYIKFLPGG